MVQIKPDEIWSVETHSANLLEGHNATESEDVLACGAKILHMYHMFLKRSWPGKALSPSNGTVHKRAIVTKPARRLNGKKSPPSQRVAFRT